MSFYGSEPNTNPETTSQQLRQPGLPANAWSAALDHFVFQETDNVSNPMGALRRSNSQTAPTDPNFSVVEAAAAELGNYANSNIDNSRFSIESGRLDLDGAIQRRAAPNNVEQALKIPGTSTAPSYRQPWDRSAITVSGCNVSSLPPEAFEIADELGVDPPLDNCSLRNKGAREVGLGPYVQRIMSFNREQQRGTREQSLEWFWKPLIASFFAPNATMHVDLVSKSNSKPRAIKIPAEALPRIWKSKFDAGVNEERILMENPCEFLLPSGMVVVDCPRTVILTTYANRTIQTDGQLRVTFHRDKKIMAWEFSPQQHVELFTKKAISMGLQPASCVEFGIPAAVVRMMMIANDVNTLTDKIGAEISRIVNDPDKATATLRGLSSGAEALPREEGAAFAGMQSNGNAYRALRSMLDGPQMDQSMSGPNHGSAQLGRSDSNSGVPGIAEELGIDVKSAMENDTSGAPDLRDALSTWGEDPTTAAMLSSLLEATGRPQFKEGEREDAMRSGTANQAEAKESSARGAGAAETTPDQGAPPAVETGAGVASGHGGWAVGAGSGHGLGSIEGGADGLDPTLQLLTAATNASLTLQHDMDIGQRSSVSRQSAPPGLSMFTPQSAEAERAAPAAAAPTPTPTPTPAPTQQGRRERGGRGRGARAAEAGGARRGARQALKETEGPRGFARASSKARREGAAEAMKRGGAGNSEFGQASGADAGGKGKELAPTGGGRRGGRGASAEERAEKRQKGASQSGTPK